MLNSSSSTSSSSSSSPSSKPPVSSFSSSSSYNTISSNHNLQHSLLPHPTLVPPHHPHYHHLHHLHPRKSIDSTPPHCLYPPFQASINSVISTRDSISTSGLVSETSSIHNHSIDPHYYTTDCSPRSVIRHIHSSSSAPSPDPCRPSSYDHTNFTTNAGTPSTTSHHEAPNLSIIRPHCHSLYDPSQGAFFLVHNQSAARDHCHLPPWSSPKITHHHYHDVCSTSSGNISYEAGTQEGNEGAEMRRSPKFTQKGGSKSGDLRKQREIGKPKSGYSSGSAAVDKPCMINSSDAARYEAIRQANTTEAWLRTAAEPDDRNLNVSLNRYGTGTNPISETFFDSTMQFRRVDHGQKSHMERSLSCDLHNSGGSCTNARATSRQSTSSEKQTYSTYSVNTSPKSPDALLHYVDGVADHDNYCTTKGRAAQLGSKWEDADKWVRPPNHHQYDTGCRGLPSLGLLRMSSCINSGTATKPQYINPMPHTIFSSNCTANPVPNTILSSNCSANPVPNTILNSNCTANYSAAGSNRSRSSSASSYIYSNSGGLCGEQPNIINHPSLTRQAVPVDCFNPHFISSNPHLISSNPHLISSNPDLAYATQFAPSPRLAKDLQMKGQALKQMNEDQPHSQANYAEKARQKHHASSGSASTSGQIVKSPTVGIRGLMKEVPSANGSWNAAPLPPPSSAHLCTSDHLTDRFASGGAFSCVTSQLVYAKDGDKDTLIKPFTQESVMVSMVSLREAGTQMSSIDGSGSLSRYTSKNGSPQKSLSPVRHNTPACTRSLSGSTNVISNIRHIGKQGLDLEELVKCHRAKLELQALSDGERIYSFHRTTSNWSSREMEEADLSRSLRHSTDLEESSDAKNHHLPRQGYSWKKEEDFKLARLQLKEAKIKAWEDKKKSKAEAQLKRLEVKLAEKRSQTTTRIMGSLAAAQRKAEEMRTSVYAQQRRATKNNHRFRHRSLSPLSRCTCFSTF